MPKKNKPSNDSQVEDFLRKVEAALRVAGGQCTFTSLGTLVARPKGLGGSHKKVLSRYPQRFKICWTGVEHTVRLPGVSKAKETKRVTGSSSRPAAHKEVSASIQHLHQLRKGTWKAKNEIVPTVSPSSVDTAQKPGKYVSCLAKLNLALAADPELRGEVEEEVLVALDCEGVPESLDILQVATSKNVYVIDCLRIGVRKVCSKLQKFFQTENTIKLMHDLHQDALALSRHGNIELLRGILDTQLAAEHIWGEMHLGFNALMRRLGRQEHSTKNAIHEKMDREPDLWKKRPLPSSLIDYAALDVDMLLQAGPKLLQALNSAQPLIMDASILRAKFAISNNGARSICFDKGNQYKIISAELLRQTRPQDVVCNAALEEERDTKVLVQLIPERLRREIIVVKENGCANHSKTPDCALPGPKDVNQLSDIVLDLGRRPHCWIKDKRFFLCSNAQDILVEQQDIDFVVEKIGGFGSDHRAGLERQLHRISGIYDREHRVVGLTIRAGRFFQGNADMLQDILLGTDSGVLFLGPPGSGKTTIVRDATRVLAESNNVCVIDTSNEIAGDGIIPHECIGLARRIQVPSLNKQGSVMVECVQNHTPHVMVIDEIGRSKEVEAALTVKQRGVRIIGSAHGNLRSLLKNRDLRGLLGGVEVVTLGDAAAREQAKGISNPSKLKSQRRGEPIFDVIVELQRGEHHDWQVVLNTANAVDRILEGKRYNAQRRVRKTDGSNLRLELVRA